MKVEVGIFLVLTSESAPLSAPGHLNVTNSWQRLCTTKQQAKIKKTENIDIL